MSKTVVGYFKTIGEAQHVKAHLVSQGFETKNVQVIGNEQNTSSSTLSAEQETGIVASIKHFFSSLSDADDSDRGYYAQGVIRGGAVLSVTVADGQEDAVANLLEQHGARDVNESANAKPAATAVSGAVAAGSSIPVVQEELLVGKRQVERGGVRVYSRIVETPVEEAVLLRDEHVTIDRRPVDRPAAASDFDTFKEGHFELAETAEEVVVSKDARVVEEVTFGKEVTERTQKVTDKLRHTEVEVEELAPTSVKGAATAPRK